MFRLFVRLYLLLIIGYIACSWLVGRAVDAYFAPTFERYNDELLRGQVDALVSVLRPLPSGEREHGLMLLRPHYGLRLSLVDGSTLSLTPGEQAKLQAGGFISRNEYSEFIAPLDSPAGAQNLRIEFPVEPPVILRANIGAYLVLAALLGGVLLIWVRPHWRDLEALRAAANRFGAGNLAARVQIGARSTVHELAEHFNHMAERTQQLIAAQRELTNAVSHELRTPISRLEFELNLLSSVNDERDRERLLGEMRADLGELEKMVSELLTYARLEHPELKLTTETVDTDSWLSAVIGVVALEADANGIRCRGTTNELQSMAIEPRFMSRALVNLLRNAIHYARARVDVTVERAGSGHFRLLVDDDGPGIPAADRVRIFEPFVRLDESRNRATGGVGLGLAIVRRVAEWHGGTVAVVDSPLGGCRFVLSWPG